MASAVLTCPDLCILCLSFVFSIPDVFALAAVCKTWHKTIRLGLVWRGRVVTQSMFKTPKLFVKFRKHNSTKLLCCKLALHREFCEFPVMAQKFPQLRELNLTSTTYTHIGLLPPQLHTLRLHDNINTLHLWLRNETFKLQNLYISACTLGGQFLEGLLGTTSLRVVSFAHTSVNDFHMRSLIRYLPNLESLSLHSCFNITAAAFQYPAESLQNLSLTSLSNVGGAICLESKFPHLVSLRLFCMMHLHRVLSLPNSLQSLAMHGCCRLRDVNAMYKLTNLTHIQFCGMLTFGLNVSNLAQPDKVQVLHVDYSDFVDDAWMKALPRLPQLQRLGLRGTRVTDVGVEHLWSFPSLFEVFFPAFTVSPAMIEKAREHWVVRI